MSIEDLARRAGAVVGEVARTGTPAVITDHGRPLVQIVPLSNGTDLYETDVLKLFGGYGAFSDAFSSSRSAVDELIAERRAEQAGEDAL